MGSKALRRLQLGLESTPGTAVVASILWRGVGTLDDQLQLSFSEPALSDQTQQAYISSYLGAVSMEDAPATFEQLPVLLGAALVAESPVADAPGSGWVYTYELNAGTVQGALDTYTVEGGDDAGAERATYAFVEHLKLSGACGEALLASADWLTQQVAPAAFTPNLNIPDVEEILVGLGRLYIDATTLGATQISGAILDVEFDLQSGWAPYRQPGSLDFSTINRDTPPEASLAVTFLHNASALTEKAAWRAGALRLVRLQFDGATLTTAGVYSQKMLRLDLAGHWEQFEKLAEVNGVDVVRGILRIHAEPVTSRWLSVVVVTDGGRSPVQSFAQAVGGTLLTGGALVRATRKLVSGVIEPPGEGGTSGYKIIAGTIAPIGALVRLIKRALSGKIEPPSGGGGEAMNAEDNIFTA